MRYCILILLLFISLPVSAQNVPAVVLKVLIPDTRSDSPDTHSYSQAASQVQKTLIQKIVIEGFVLGDKNQFVKLFKPYRNKHLSVADMDTILQELQEIYEQAGYQGLVSIEYHVIKRNLTFTVSLIT
jgi:hemolysin activation/secretion protein